MTIVERDALEFGKHPTLVGFAGHKVSVRKGDGSLLSQAVSPYPSALHNYVATNRSGSTLDSFYNFKFQDIKVSSLDGMRHLNYADLSKMTHFGPALLGWQSTLNIWKLQRLPMLLFMMLIRFDILSKK